MAGSVIVLLLATGLAVRLIVEALPGSACREDEGRAYVWLLFSPLVAIGAVIATSVVAFVAGSSGSRAALVVAPVLTWVVGWLVGSALEVSCVTSTVAWGCVTILMPATVGVALVLLAVHRWARRHRPGDA